MQTNVFLKMKHIAFFAFDNNHKTAVLNFAKQ